MKGRQRSALVSDWSIKMIVYDSNYTVYNDQSMNQEREKERRVCALTPGTESKQTRSRNDTDGHDMHLMTVVPH